MHKEKLQTTLIPVQTDNITEGKEITTTVVAEVLEKEDWLVEVEEKPEENRRRLHLRLNPRSR